ncbi:MAG: CPBP family intramembrane metalloprotease [Deltaproteobacteria bacterium]|nr:MAG: CPBP family intramembrane metalloprotease [Deltaproteobacteria bacterium]
MACGALLIVYIALGLAKVAASVPYLGILLQNALALGQIYLPTYLCDRRNESLETIGLSSRAWQAEVRDAALWALCLLPPYALGVHLVLRHVPQLAPGVPPELVLGLSWSPAWRLARQGVVQLFGVALPEEVFFRGYLQPRLHAQRHVAVLLAAAAFALAHWLLEWQPARLLTFFPGLVFGWQRQRRGSVVGCVLLHAGCNVASEALWAAYGLG